VRGYPKLGQLMRRASLERPRALRVWREHLRFAHPYGPIDCSCEFQPNRFRKSERAGGCRNSRCFLCHPGKLLGRLTPQQWRSELSLYEWSRELGFAAQRPRRLW